MVDDKDGSAPDPWAGIDDEGSSQAADGFTFSFDASGEIEENPFAPPAEEPIAASISPAPDADDAPIFPIDAAASEPDAEADPFASLSIDADDATDVAADISSWLSEPSEDAAGDPPLAVFPSQDAELADEPVMSTDALPDAPVAFDATGSDDLHAFAEPGGVPAAGSSHVEVGTGFSGIVSPSEVDPTSDVMAADDWPEAEATEATLDDFSTDDQPSFDASGFDGVSDGGDAAAPGDLHADNDGHELAIAASAAAATAAVTRGKSATRKQGGGIGQLVGIVLGGLMAIPITYAILIWGFQKDPFKLVGMVPEQVAFLLPQKLQPGFKKPGGPRLDAASALDNLPDAVEPAEPVPVEPADPEVLAEDAPGKPVPSGDGATVPGPAAPEDSLVEPRPPAPASQPPASFDDIVAAAAKTPPAPAAPPEPEPLDLSALQAAVGEATASFETLAAADPESPDRKKLLVGWYKRLAAVAEQLVLLEKVAADSGRTFDEASAAIESVCNSIGADADAQRELAKLSSMWLSSKKRPADGAVLLATFDAARQVGPYWSTRVTVDGAESRSVAVISRVEPRVDPGSRVLVTGVLFDGDVVWASDVRPIEKKAAPVEDLF
ncbi:MAG: hypothetical protein WCR51_09180 [Planctomycetia bacterium]